MLCESRVEFYNNKCIADSKRAVGYFSTFRTSPSPSKSLAGNTVKLGKERLFFTRVNHIIASSLGRYVFGSEISYNKLPPRLPGLGC
jgi:hypothetical protein